VTLAGERLATFARWLDASSASRLSPCAHKRRAPRRGFLGSRLSVVQRHDDMIAKGRFGELLPWDFAKPFDVEFGEQSLPLLFSFDQWDGATLAEAADLSAFPSLPSRLGSPVQRRCQRWAGLFRIGLYSFACVVRWNVGKLADQRQRNQ